jgi:hypothetical protein
MLLFVPYVPLPVPSNLDFHPLAGGVSMRATNDAHKYPREPPPVKPFPIDYSGATNRKSW